MSLSSLSWLHTFATSYAGCLPFSGRVKGKELAALFSYSRLINTVWFIRSVNSVSPRRRTPKSTLEISPGDHVAQLVIFYLLVGIREFNSRWMDLKAFFSDAEARSRASSLINSSVTSLLISRSFWICDKLLSSEPAERIKFSKSSISPFSLASHLPSKASASDDPSA